MSASTTKPKALYSRVVVRDLDIPTNGYPSLQEGQRLLEYPQEEFDKLYNVCQTLVRSFHITNPPNKSLRHGERAENHETLVLPIEAAYPKLRRCKESWGVRWIIKKAKHAVAMKQSCERRETMIREWRERQKAEAKRFQEISDFALLKASAEEVPDAGVVTDPAMGMSRDMDMADVDTSVIETGPGVAKAPVLRSLMERHIANKNVTSLAEHLKMPVYQSPLSLEDKACSALFKESRAWLCAGPARYSWQIKK